MKFLIVMLAGLIADSACAQDRQQTPFEKALSDKLNTEINSGLVCSVTLIAAQRDLEIAKARIKELEAQVSK